MLKVRRFETADLEWLDFVLAGRAGVCHGYDIVVGPTADDDTMISLRNYSRGVYGPVGVLESKRALLNVLEPQNLGVQVCLCNQRAVELAVAECSLVDWRSLK